MRCMKSWGGGSFVSLAVSLGLLSAAHAVRGENFSALPESGIFGLVSQSDLEARGVVEQSWNDASRPIVSVKSLARQSVPDQNRSSHYRLREVFAHSKTVAPLLVADLEPPSLLYVRPMSGHSVGAAPSARWTRSVSIVEVAPESSR